MINVTQENLTSFRQTNRLICAEALSRNLRVTVPVMGSALITIHRDNAAPIAMYSSAPPGTTFAAALQSDNKYATFQALSDASLPVLPTLLIRKDKEGGLLDEALSWPTGIVTKPLDGAHGDGITVDISEKAALIAALEKAYEASISGRVALLQQMYIGAVDLRFLCIDFKFVAAVRRIPARVFGNGTNTIKELIEKSNSDADRGERYVARLATIDINEALEYVANVDQIDRVPHDGEEVLVLGKANYGSGGETENITNQIPDWLITMAEHVAKVSRLPLCGVDILVSGMPQLDSSEESLTPMVNEVNKCPSLYIHEHPTNNEGSEVTKLFIDYLLSQ
jgi:cyanophycin synthetase